METVTLGRTGLEVSVVGLGCGGHSRLGMTQGKDESQASRLVSEALDLGINFIDTARAYRTEVAVGLAIKNRRDQVVISTKSSAGRGGDMLTADDVVQSLEKSLKRLQTDYVDVFNLHGVSLEQYAYCVDEILPALIKQQDLGKIRFLGITEAFGRDPAHRMLQVALTEDLFDVVMVGFNMLNPSARKSVFPLTIKHNVATQIMFAVRRALSQPDILGEVVEKLISNGDLEAAVVERKDPLGFVAQHPDVTSVVQAAYRFCRHEPGATVVLTGTGNEAHLRQNIEAILAGPLPLEIARRLETVFGHIDSVSGN